MAAGAIGSIYQERNNGIDDPHKTILAAGPIYTLTGNLIKGGLKALNDNFCSAYFEYKSAYTLRAYFGAPTVRDHR